MDGERFPDFVRSLPEADIPFAGLRGWLLQGENSQLLFLESDTGVSLPEHSHGAQWGFVVDGEMDLTVQGRTGTYARGASYFIPPGVPHSAVIRPGFRAVDYFADRNRYRPLAGKD